MKTLTKDIIESRMHSVATVGRIKDAVDHAGDDTSELMEKVKSIFGKLTEDQISTVEELLKLHNSKQPEERDKMLRELGEEDKDINELPNLVMVLEEEG